MGPLALPARVLRQVGAAVEALADAARSLASLGDLLEQRLERLQASIDELDRNTAVIPPLLREQRASIESLKPLLGATKDAIERQGPRLEELTQNTAPLSAQLEAVEAGIARAARELATVREVAETVRGPTERVARLSERLPGRG